MYERTKDRRGGTAGGKVYPLSREPWMIRGVCRTSGDPDAWFPEPGQTRTPRAERAKRACRTECPVARECLLYALARGERHGIWGGLTPRQRNTFLKRAAAKRAEAGNAA